MHAEYGRAGRVCAKPNWHMLTTADKTALRQRGIAAVDVPYAAGDMVLWRSDLVHSGRAPAVGVPITPANMRKTRSV